MLVDLVDQQKALAEVVATDFRSKSLISLVSAYTVPGTVLDVGCGNGGMVAWLLEHGYDARGIDSNDQIIEAAHAFLRTRGCDVSRVRKELIEDCVARGERVDNAISMDCLEHQENDRAMFENLVRLVRPGGRLLVTVPAMPALFSERDRIVGHYRRYTRERLAELPVGLPLRVDELRYWNLLGVPPRYLYARVLKTAPDESFRYGEPTAFKRLLRSTLSLWFDHVENRIRPPVGLTLVLCATRLPD